MLDRCIRCLSSPVLHLIASARSAFLNLKILALNSCGIKSWVEIQLLEPVLPCLEELYMANNKLADLPRLIAQKEYEDATGVITDQRVVGKQAHNVCGRTALSAAT